jgi:hypothetical protein
MLQWTADGCELTSDKTASIVYASRVEPRRHGYSRDQLKIRIEPTQIID